MDLSTRDLLIVTMHQQGNTPSTIALRLSIPAATVRKRLTSADLVAYQLEQEETVDLFLKSLYHDSAVVIKDALMNDSVEIRLKAVKLLHESIGKVQQKVPESLGVTKIQNILNVMAAPATVQELADIRKYLPNGSPGIIDVEATVSAPLEDSK